MDLTERLDAMEAAIRKPSFRQSSGKANEVNYWIFDYVMFFPGTYNEQELILFNEIKDDNYYRAFRLVK